MNQALEQKVAKLIALKAEAYYLEGRGKVEHALLAHAEFEAALRTELSAPAVQPLTQVLNIVNRYLPPGGIDAAQAIHEIIGIVDPWPTAEPSMFSWQPMDEAPKTGEVFVIRYPLQGHVKQLIYWNKLHGNWLHYGVAVFPEYQKCEWSPILADYYQKEQSK